jgi:transposase
MEKSRNVAAIDCAIDAIKQGSSIRKACAQFNVSKTTVLRHLKAVESNQPRPSMGPPPALPMTLQVEIADVVRAAAQCGFGVTRSELKQFVSCIVSTHQERADEIGWYLRRHCTFAGKQPSDEWVQRFMELHHLSLLTPSTLERHRFAACADPFVVYGFYDLLQV